MKYVTAGESHGKALIAIVSDVPAGFYLNIDSINADLARRQSGYGRGGRMKIENDTVEIISGVRFGKTLGTPIALKISNRDWPNWASEMNAQGEPPLDLFPEQQPRPGHADLVGAMKIGSKDCRDILERASARETAARVAAGAVAKAYLSEFGVGIDSFVTSIGNVALDEAAFKAALQESDLNSKIQTDFKRDTVEASAVRCPSVAAGKKMMAAIDAAREAGESLGGCFVVVASGLVAGIGGYAEPNERLTSRIGAAMFSIPAIKGVEFGLGFKAAALPGSQVHDEIIMGDDVGKGIDKEPSLVDADAPVGAVKTGGSLTRKTNNAGGLEGGMTTGLPLYLRVAMKPIPTLSQPLKSIHLATHEVVEASKERSDVCAVPAAGVVAEAELAMVLADAYMNKFGRDDMQISLAAFDLYRERVWSY